MMTDNIEEENNIDETEAQLLQAMSVDDELPVYKAYSGIKLEDGVKKAKMLDIVDAIKTVFDPEIPINVYDLGLIYKINQNDDNGDIHIDMSLTAPGCPVAGVLPQQVADAVALVNGVGEVEVEVVWEPAWTLERLSEEARMMLEMI